MNRTCRFAHPGYARVWRAPGNVPHTMRAGPEGARVLDIFAPPRAEYRKAGSGFGTGE